MKYSVNEELAALLFDTFNMQVKNQFSIELRHFKHDVLNFEHGFIFAKDLESWLSGLKRRF
jgi:hypothetical protein